MRRLFFLLILCALVLSCVNQPRMVKGDESTHIEKYIDSFRSRFPKGLDNDAQREKMNKAFKAEIKDSLSSDSLFLSDFPLKCKSVLSNPNDSSLCYVHFQSWIHPDNFRFKNMNLNEVGFDIVASVPASYIDLLKENSFYCIKGTLIDFIPLEIYSTYTDDMAYTASIGIAPEVGVSGWFNVGLGMMLYKIDNIEPYSKN